MQVSRLLVMLLPLAFLTLTTGIITGQPTVDTSVGSVVTAQPTAASVDLVPAGFTGLTTLVCFIARDNGMEPS